MNKKLIVGLIQGFLLFLLTIYVESVSNGELLFTKGVLDDNLREKAIEKPLTILILFGVINLLFYVYSHISSKNSQRLILHNNICEQIFNNYIKSKKLFENKNFRVSIFVAKKKIYLKRKPIKVLNKNVFYLTPVYGTILYNLGRYQTKQEKRSCKIKFLPGEGVVGTCYLVGEFVFDEIDEYLKDQEYIDAQSSSFNIPKFKAKRLNDNSCSYIACPIKHFKQDELYGVAVVDSTTKGVLHHNNFREIEGVLNNYSVFFDKQLLQ